MRQRAEVVIKDEHGKWLLTEQLRFVPGIADHITIRGAGLIAETRQVRSRWFQITPGKGDRQIVHLYTERVP